MSTYPESQITWYALYFKFIENWKIENVRKALAWRAMSGMTRVWNVNLPCQIKLSFFYATAGSVLLHGSECWNLKPTLQKSLDGCHTRMLRAGHNISKRTHGANAILHEGRPKWVTDRCRENATSRTRPKASRTVSQRIGALGTETWAPVTSMSHTIVDVLKEDAGARNTNELTICMMKWDDWKQRWRARLRRT